MRGGSYSLLAPGLGGGGVVGGGGQLGLAGGWLLRASRVIPAVLCILVIASLCAHYYLSKAVGDSVLGHERHLLLDPHDPLSDLSGLKCDSAKARVQELLSIKASVLNELRDLEQHRQQLQENIASASTRIENLRQEESRVKTELERLKTSVEQALLAQQEVFEKNMPQISAPRRITASSQDSVSLPLPPPQAVAQCRMHSCFDYSRCSLLSNFPVYNYDMEQFKIASNDLEAFVKITVKQALGYNAHVTQNPSEACVFVALLGEGVGGAPDSVNLEESLHSLPHWGGDGRNHILLNLGRTFYSKNMFQSVNTGRAIIVQSHFDATVFRPGFDLVTPPLLGLPGGDLWKNLPPIVPAKRKYLLSFQGELPRLRSYLEKTQQPPPNSPRLREEMAMVEELRRLEHTHTDDRFLLHFTCRGGGGYGDLEEWRMCDTESMRTQVLRESTFSLVLAPPSPQELTTVTLQARVYEALKYGAVPVVLGNHVELPLSETIDWRKLALVLPKARVTEIHFLLRSLSDADLLFMRRQGRMVWERFFGSTQVLVDSILATLRERLNIPPVPAPEHPSSSIFNDSFVPLKTDANILDPDTDENLGPIEPPFPSIVFSRNYTVALLSGYEQWNNWGDPFYLYPSLPSSPLLPTEAKFSGSKLGFRPINAGSGGSGKEFSESLGGNSPREQFTIVMLTYEREQVLLNSLARLYGLPYLNKVIVVWNSPKPPPEDLRWPDIKVPIHVVRAERNSLNNRFLPYSEIETEAVLSVDDDAHLRHDEIVFGFRVWREERDRIVGFPGRYHAWDLNYGGWLYNSNYSCELSMVLTGAAFFHKYYASMYSHMMPQAIRDKVDEYVNCEDIAMNFLVSHITRKPPVKVTSRWTFRCPGCPVSLSEDDSHFTERHKCINFFTQVYGYNPLLNTQYRVDSVLFKTRLPHDKQKCFKFI
ncbi:exostosin-3-like [Portunus trituberculatus]|uniref:exostosin-3-like n=1 Tax=Portunus trituberculatus TaxID=210409 RepID=UPI001E1D0239|nr:exostosin-3-like [Portunus trituberculatus]XP_045106983.1 exostosin-3-like [Portunus trituberculatus]XP_045106984.1 exostosin-3-like [Portunus trituberculatus]XP_045106985.1 exostosin-3-like [Portunus trituberculatus]